MNLAASWTANFTTWHQFSIWIANNNIASLFLGIACPGAVIAVLHLRVVKKYHRQTREHNLQLHLATRKHAENLAKRPQTPRRSGR